MTEEARAGLVTDVAELVASEAPDGEVLGKVVRLIHDAHPLWDWSGIYLLVEDTLVIGPFAGSEEEPEHSRIRVGEGVCGAAVARERKPGRQKTCASSTTTWPARSPPARNWSS